LDLDLVELLVSTGTAREVVEDLLWAERLNLSEALSELGAYRPEDSALLRKNTFEVDVVRREGARCAVRLGEATLIVLSFSRCDRLLLEIPPETIVVFREPPEPLLGRVENVLEMRIQRIRRLGQLDNLVLEGAGFTLNAMESRVPSDARSAAVGQEVHALIPVAAIRTRPVARKE
jgi:ABC-type molybdate transport system ATPase subunit